MIDSKYLKDNRITKIVRSLADEVEASKSLTFLNRVPLETVYDNRDIIATLSQAQLGADIISNDAQARAVSIGTLEVKSSSDVLPNIKLGKRMTQAHMELLTNFAQGTISADDQTGLLRINGFQAEDAAYLVRSVQNTMNYMVAQMYLDSVVYDRFGVKITNNFGTPANLKSSLIGTAQWTSGNLATMDAVSALQQLQVTASTEYGKTYNRVDMSTEKFQLIIQSTKFKDQVRTLNGLNPTDPVDINIWNLGVAKSLFERISGFEVINLEDKNFVVELPDGTKSSARVMPTAKVLLSDSREDKDSSIADFAIGTADEFTVRRLAGKTTEQPTPGIYSYVEEETNPPSFITWAVAKGMPRKKDVYMNGILTVE